MKKAKFLTLVFSSFFLITSCTSDDTENVNAKSTRDVSSKEFENVIVDQPIINDNPDLMVSHEKFESFFPLETWSISPDNLEDENLSFLYMRGMVYEKSWYINKYFSDLYLRNDHIPGEIQEGVGRLHGISPDSGNGIVPPLAIKFLATKKVTYRLKFKVENNRYHTNRSFAVLVDEVLVDYVLVNENNYFVFSFKSATTKELKIAIGGLYVNYDSEFIKTSEIVVEKLD